MAWPNRDPSRSALGGTSRADPRWLEVCTLDGEVTQFSGRLREQQRRSSVAFWHAEAQRRALHPPPVPGLAPARHRLSVDVQEGNCDAERHAVLRERIAKKFNTSI